jgi:hypothetical protein
MIKVAPTENNDILASDAKCSLITARNTLIGEEPSLRYSFGFVSFFNRQIADSTPSSEFSSSKSLMEINRTKQLARRVRSPQAFKARAAKMRDAIADRHGTKRPAVGGVTAPRKRRKRGNRGKNIRKSNTGSSVGSDGDSDTETSQSYPSKLVVPDEDASVSSLKMLDHPSLLDIEAEHDEHLFVGGVPLPKLSDQEKSLDFDSSNASSSVVSDAWYS